MIFETLADQFSIMEHVLAIILGTPRLFMIIQTVPFFGSSIVTGQLRVTVSISCYLIIHPMIFAQVMDPASIGAEGSVFFYAALILKEVLIGTLIGLTSGILFWAVQSAGFFIDNQRGLSQAAGADILTGEQTSPLGSFLFQAIVFVFFMTGSFMVFLHFIYTSYEAWPVLSLVPLQMVFSDEFPLWFASQVNYLMLLMLLLSGPIVMACLLTDFSLGLMNRFASQLNVYVLAMPIKSALASFLIIFYFAVLIQEVIPLFSSILYNIDSMRDLK